MVDNVLFKHFKAIGDIKSVINGASDIEDALHKCVHIIREVSGAETAVIWYFDKDGDKLLHPTYAKGAHTSSSRGRSLRERASWGRCSAPARRCFCPRATRRSISDP